MCLSERRAAERQRDQLSGDMGGNGDTAAAQSGGQGAVVVGSLLLQSAHAVFPCVAASKCVFLPQLDHYTALCRHNTAMKVQRIKCCVTLRKRNSVIRRACARLCVHAHVHMHFCVVRSISVSMS